MIVRTRFTRRQLNQVLVVPLYAVVDRDGQKYLFIKNGDNARQQKALLGAILSGEVVVREGLHAGDEVVVKGRVKNNVDIGAGYNYEVLLEEASFNQGQ